MILKIFLPIMIAILLGTEGIFTGFYFVGIPVVRLLEILIFVLILKQFNFDINSNQFLLFTFKFLGILILLLFLKLGVMTFYENELDLSLFQEVFTVVIYIIVIYLGYFMLNKSFSFINIILLLNFFIFLIAFFQSDITPFTDFARDLKLNYFNQNSDSEISERSLFSRLTGLYSFTLVLGYALLSSAIVSLYAYIKTKKNIYFYFFIFIGIVNFLTLTRSIIISWLILFIFIIIKQWQYNNKIQKIFILLFLIIFSTYSIKFIYEKQAVFSRVLEVNDSSAGGKFPLFVTGAYTLIQNPIAITDKDYTETKKEMFNVFGHPDILKFPSHNALINLGFKFTLLGLIIFLYYVYVLFTRYIKYIDPKYRSFIKIASLAYLSNGLVHNSFIFNLDFPILFFISIIAYEYNQHKLAQKNLLTF